MKWKFWKKEEPKTKKVDKDIAPVEEKNFSLNDGVNLLESPYTTDEDFLSLPECHTWTYSCITALSSSVSSVPIKVVKRTDEGTWELLNRKNDTVALLEDINNYQFQQEFIELVAQRLATAGKCFVEVTRSKGKAVALDIISYSDVKLYINPKTGEISFFEFSFNDGSKSKLPANDVLYFKLPHPSNVYDGLSPISASREGVLADFYAQKYNKAFFKNGATLRGSLQTEKGLSNRAWSRLADMWRVVYGGVDNSHKVMVLEEGLKYSAITVSPKDMEFIEQRKFSREELLAVFRVYPVVLGLLEGASYANAKVQLQLFYEQTVSFYLTKIASVLSNFIRNEMIDPSVRVVFDLTQVPALTSNMSEIIEWGGRATTTGIMTINEIRDIIGRSPVAWGDIWHGNSAMVPLADSAGVIPRPELGDTTVGGQATEPKSLVYDRIKWDGTKSVSGYLIKERWRS